MRLRLAVAAVAVALLAAGCGATGGLRVEGSGPPGSAPRSTVPPPSSTTAGTSPSRPSAVRHRIPIGAPAAIAYYNGDLWVAVHPGSGRLVGTLLRYDVSTGQPGAPGVQLPPAHRRYLLAVGDAGVWVAGDSGVWEIDPSTGAIQLAVPLGGRPTALLEAGAVLWATVPGSPDGWLVRIDPASGRIVRRIAVGPEPLAITALQNRGWVSDGSQLSVDSLRAQSGRSLGSTPLPQLPGRLPSQLTVFDGALWVYEQNALARVAVGTSALERTYLVDPVAGGDMAAGSGGVWLAVAGRGGRTAVGRFDPASGTFPSSPVVLGRGPVSLATDGSGVWAMIQGEGVLVDVQPATP